MRADVGLARRLVEAQFPRWSSLPVRAVETPGWDNASFRLGDDMVMRLPSAAEYEPQVHKEHLWLPRLAPSLPVQIPAPVALGKPSEAFPWHWSIRRWIAGETASPERIDDLGEFARDLAAFLRSFHAISTAGGPDAGPQSFHRGGALSVYDDQVRDAVRLLSSRIDGSRALQIWDEAGATRWRKDPVWVHGDVSAGNLLVRHGRLAAVIDFGQLAIGDPACDLAIGWTLLSSGSRDIFLLASGLDSETWKRGRAWALWKALIMESGLARTTALESTGADSTLRAILGS